MKAYVFTDKALQRHAGQFVWLSLDVEKGQNAPYKKKYGIDALPMYFVVDPKTEKIALRWVGGATVPQLQKILGDGLTAVKGGGRGVEQIVTHGMAIRGGEGRWQARFCAGRMQPVAASARRISAQRGNLVRPARV